MMPFSLVPSSVVVALFVGILAQGSPSAQSPSCDKRVNNTPDKLLECVTVEGVRWHQAALQTIADANNGHRVSGSPGYDQSVEYAAGVLRAAGYAVTIQPFQFQTFITHLPTLLEQVSPPPAGPVANSIFSYSGSGDVTAEVSTLAAITGCEAADYAGFPAGNIALISRGICTFELKATNAFNAGASGVVIYNNVPGVLNGTLTNAFTLDIGVTSVTLDVGQQLAATPGLILRLRTDTFRGMATSHNVLAESATGDPNNVVMAGAHLDSVNAGPGIQDNGSGSAAILEVARQMGKVKPRNKVRFALWGALESGFVGSTHYVENLSLEQRAQVALYLNFDIIGSPNHVFFIYDGDDSDGEGAGPGPGGSAEIERTFEGFYAARSLPYKGIDLHGGADYGPFIDVGIPSGGLFTGATDIKTADEVLLWGGSAGTAYDPCYHLACDTFDNINLFALDINADAVAHAVLKYAMNTADVNGRRGKGNFKPPPGQSGEHRASTR